MKRKLTLAMLAMMSMACLAQKTVSISVENKAKTDRMKAPVVIQLEKYGMNVRKAVVTLDGKEIPCQLDDINGDKRMDELCFLADMKRKSKKVFSITLSEEGEQKEYTPEVYVEMLLTNRKVKSTNKQDLYISELKVDRGVNPYWMLHHHGAAFENSMVGYRIYFDHRQTIDIYGKYKEGLELRDTQFYPDEQQKAAGYGDDVLWVGQTFGLGALRGWNGKEPTMVSDVEHRSQRIVARGPLRTIVEVKDEGWKPQEGNEPIDMTMLYTLYAGQRDCDVDVTFSKKADGYLFSTGIINVKNSTEYSDKQGLRGCWGKDWPVSAKDSVGRKRETVGLGIYIPAKYVKSEEVANKDNYGYVISTPTDKLSYKITFGSDNEQFGYHNAEEWYTYLQQWKKEIEQPLIIKEL